MGSTTTTITTEQVQETLNTRKATQPAPDKTSKPLTGVISLAPESWVPYLQLMRIGFANGYCYFWLPHVYGALLAALEHNTSLDHFLRINGILMWGVVIMSGAECTWNDIVDAPFDALQTRTKQRPIPRRAISLLQAYTFTAFQTMLSLATLALLPELSALYAIPAIAGWVFYPYAKRVTNYPQVCLCFVMAWGVFMGASAIGSDPLNLSPLLQAIKHDRSSIASALQQISINSPATCAFYFASCLWTMQYEIIYSHQDASEDEAAGVKNIVLLYMNPNGKTSIKPLLVQFAVIQVLLLSTVGALVGTSALYYTGTVATTAAACAVVLSRVKLDEQESCAWWFFNGSSFGVGFSMAAGLVGEYALRLLRA